MHDLTLQQTQDNAQVAAISNNAIVIANVIELATQAVRNLAKTDLADALGDQSQTRQLVANTVANRIKQRLSV